MLNRVADEIERSENKETTLELRQKLMLKVMNVNFVRSADNYVRFCNFTLISFAEVTELIDYRSKGN